MTYDHATKAGNSGDLHKHAVLATVATGLRAIRGPGLCLVDAYAGLALGYPVLCGDPRHDALLKLTGHLADGGDYPEYLEPWLSMLRQVYVDDAAGVSYPGSAGVLSGIAGASGELHVNDAAAPPDSLFHTSALMADMLLEDWPTRDHGRGCLQPDLIFLDPSYTEPDSWLDLSQAVHVALGRWPDTCVMYWSMSGSLDHPEVRHAPARHSLISTYTLSGESSSMVVYNPPAYAELTLEVTGAIEFLVDLFGGDYSVTARRLERRPGGH